MSNLGNSEMNQDPATLISKTGDNNLSRKRKCPENNGDVCSCPSEFDFRTEEGSANQYFQFYGSLVQQQNMMQDFTRTSTYQRAIHENYEEFRDKVVLDVGAGSGILSFFAAQAGARRVYAVEASSMAAHCECLAAANGLNNVIRVITGKIEEIQLPEMVDIIISEPMGYMLVNERMLESYVYARKFLKKDGRMFPTKAILHIALFSDEQLYIEQFSRTSFWCQESFHGVNLTALKSSVLDEIFHQPIVDSWHTDILASRTITWEFDFEHDNREKLHRIDIPFELLALRTTFIHGIATWFDVGFVGKTKTTWLSTAPTEPLTHWYQVRCLIKTPIMTMANELVKGRLLMVANDKQSYDLELEIGTQNGQKQKNLLDLKMPHFRYTGLPTQTPPGNSNENPSDLLNQLLMSQQTTCDLAAFNGIEQIK